VTGHHLTAGSTARPPFALEVTPELAGWGYSSLRVLDLVPGAAVSFETGQDEMLVLPLTGSCGVTCDGAEFAVEGRAGVFDRVTDFVYLPRDASVRVESAGGGRFALPAARATRRLPARYGPAGQVPVELRGAGSCSRQVNNFATPEAFDCDKLIACEVLTPGGNWSSYPPHKHDECRAGEARLEEIYYFEVTVGGEPGPAGTGRSAGHPAPGGIGYQRVCTSGPGREIDVFAEVRTGDVVLIPHGWHGPSMAVPGYDLYYLNVMAGPAAERTWLICDDPAHAWVRGTWAGQPVDPRLPMTSVREKP
jgi:5-deoxy-glucuronate isomerase